MSRRNANPQAHSRTQIFVPYGRCCTYIIFRRPCDLILPALTRILTHWNSQLRPRQKPCYPTVLLSGLGKLMICLTQLTTLFFFLSIKLTIQLIRITFIKFITKLNNFVNFTSINKLIKKKLLIHYYIKKWRREQVIIIIFKSFYRMFMYIYNKN